MALPKVLIVENSMVWLAKFYSLFSGRMEMIRVSRLGSVVIGIQGHQDLALIVIASRAGSADKVSGTDLANMVRELSSRLPIPRMVVCMEDAELRRFVSAYPEGAYGVESRRELMEMLKDILTRRAAPPSGACA